MGIKEKYKELTLRDLSLNDYQEIVSLKNLCKIEINHEYELLCDILIIDIYINENLFDDALNVALKSFDSIDNIVFKKIYVSLLERIIYIFIQKKNYKSAYRYAFLKRNSIDLENVDEVNRWYLEMAYIYAELNQNDKALLNLKAIISNYPDEQLRALALSNMSKLYIDAGLIEEAKKSLSDCIKLVEKLNDEEGKMYCEYLNAKLYALEKNYKLARQSFHDIFKNLRSLPNDYLSIANEYISLLIEMQLYDEALKVSNKYIDSIEKSDDLYIKKDYYKNYLKISILKNRNIKEDFTKLLEIIDHLESEITKNDAFLTNESNEDDKNLEVNQKLKNVINKIEKTINLINIALVNNNERDSFMEFSNYLEEIVNLNEALFVVFTKANFEILPEFFESINKVNTYNYKKKRLYEREFSYSNLSNTVIEMLMASNHEIMIDFSDSLLPLKDLCNNKTYIENKVRSLIAIPLNYEKEMFACAVFTSSDNSLTDMDSFIILKIACKLLEFKLITLFYQENLRSQKNILQIALNDLQEGMFYLEPFKNKLLFSEQLASFLNLEHRNMNKDDYQKNISEDDLVNYQHMQHSIDLGEAYQVEYNILIKNRYVRLKEKASPYITKDGIIKFYVGTITKVENYVIVNQKTTTSILNNQDFLSFYSELPKKAKSLDFKFTLAHFKITNLNDFNYEIKDESINYIYSVVKENFSFNTYLLKDNTFVSLLEVIDYRIIDKKIKTILNKLDQGILYLNQSINFDSKASVVRYPRDSFNFEEILEFSNMALLSEERYQIFTEEIHKTYLKKNMVLSCVNEQLKKDYLEVLYLPLEAKEQMSSFEVKYNITGLRPKEVIDEYLDEKTIVPFEKLLFVSLLKEIRGMEKSTFYLHLSAETIDVLMKEDFFTQENHDLYEKVVICITNQSPILGKLISYLDSFGFKVNINYRIMKKINVGIFFDYNINGLVINDAIDSEEREKLISFCELFKLELLTNYEYPDYNKLIFRTDKLINISQIR